MPDPPISLVTGGLSMVLVQHLIQGCSQVMWACACVHECGFRVAWHQHPLSEKVISDSPTLLSTAGTCGDAEDADIPTAWIAQLQMVDIKSWQSAPLCDTVRAHLGRSRVLSARTTLIKLPHWHCYTIPQPSALVHIHVFKYRLRYWQGHVV